MKSNLTTILAIVIFCLLIFLCFYYLRVKSIQSFYTQKVNEKSPTPTKTISLLDGQYICRISIPTSSSITIQIDEGKIYGSAVVKSGDHLVGVFNENILYIWDQEKQQGTKFTNVTNLISQIVSQNTNSCKKASITDSGQFTIPNSVTFKENTSSNPLDILQSLQ